MKPIHPSKTCFLNVGIGEWYSTGTDRLKGSLIQHGFEGDILTWKDEWPCSDFPRECVYTVKASAFNQAIKRGYRTIIWGDSSVTAVRNTANFVAKINADGYWIGQSGYNAAQTASDAQLAYFGVDRDTAQTYHDCASGLFGVNMDFEKPRNFIEAFVKAGREQAFHGSRKHAKQSRDPRFLFCRQDQSAASLILGKLGMPLRPFISECKFLWDRDSGQTFHLQGM
jgi:hypothetical protein